MRWAGRLSANRAVVAMARRPPLQHRPGHVVNFDAQVAVATENHRGGRRSLRLASWGIFGMVALIAACLWLVPIERAEGHIRLVGELQLGLAASVVALVTLVIFLRGRLSRLVKQLAAEREVLVEQNRELSQMNAMLGAQSATLQTQAATLGERTDALEVLSRRLAEGQRVAHIGYWEIDSSTGEVYWSDEMYRIAGLPLGTLPVPTGDYLDSVHPDDRATMIDIARRAVEELAEFTQQYRLLDQSDPAGPFRTVQSKGRVILDAHGRRKLVGTVQDITERVQLETQLHRAQKMEAIGQLAGGVAHDFNNVLTVIESYTGLLLMRTPASDATIRPDVEEIRDAARRAAALTRQLLAFSRQQVLRPRLLNINDAIDGVGKMLQRLLGEQINVQTALASDVQSIRADPTQLEQVLVNLAVNARDAMQDGGTLTIETANVILDGSFAQRRPGHVAGSYVMLSVADTGCGIAPGVLDRIFEPFFTTKDIGRGTGLGLSTVHGIVEQSGGHVWVYSEVGHGTTFKVYLPAVTDLADAPGKISATDTITRGGDESILLVEDDAAVRLVAVTMLRRAGYTVHEATNGVDAVKLAGDATVTIDLVVSDVVMPDLGGRDLLVQVERLRPGLPVVLMSGYTRDGAGAMASLPSLHRFIEKPFGTEQFIATVRAALDERSTLAS
jgi:two-component system cell cycle sensor histidine kinase/response regulator CckA